MKVLHVCSEDAMPMRNIIGLYDKTMEEIGVDIDISFSPEDVSGYDIIHGHYSLTKPVLKAARKAGRKNIPFILHSHGSDVRLIKKDGPEKLPLYHRIVSRYVRKKADRVLLSTPDLLEWTEGLYVPNPVDIEKFRPMDVEKRDRVLLMGRFVEGGGILDVIKKNESYDCINWGDDIDFPSNVNTLDFLPHDELPELLNRYERMIGPLVDPVSLARLEAMASSLDTYTDFPETYTQFYGFENMDEVDDPREFVKRYHHPDKIADLLVDIYRSLL